MSLWNNPAYDCICGAEAQERFEAPLAQEGGLEVGRSRWRTCQRLRRQGGVKGPRVRLGFRRYGRGVLFASRILGHSRVFICDYRTAVTWRRPVGSRRSAALHSDAPPARQCRPRVRHRPPAGAACVIRLRARGLLVRRLPDEAGRGAEGAWPVAQPRWLPRPEGVG